MLFREETGVPKLTQAGKMSFTSLCTNGIKVPALIKEWIHRCCTYILMQMSPWLLFILIHSRITAELSKECSEMCYVLFEYGAFFQQVQCELYLQWKCEGNENGSSVIWEFPNCLGWPKTCTKACGKVVLEPNSLPPALSLSAAKLLAANSSRHALRASTWKATTTESVGVP